MPRYRVYTYASPIAKKPYLKDDSNTYSRAFKSFEKAAKWNYTVVLFDSEEVKFLELHQSWAGNWPEGTNRAIETLEKGAGKIVESGSKKAGVSVPDIKEAIRELGMDENPLTLAMRNALEDVLGKEAVSAADNRKKLFDLGSRFRR